MSGAFQSLRHFLVPLLLVSACGRPAAQHPYDLLIAGGSVLNGEGAPAVRPDVAIRGGRIAAIGDLQTAGYKSCFEKHSAR